MLLNKIYSYFFVFIISFAPLANSESIVDADHLPDSKNSSTPSTGDNGSSYPSKIQGAEENKNVLSSIGKSKLVDLKCDDLQSAYTADLKLSCNKLKESASSCSGKYDFAAPICNTESNPDLLSTISKIQALMGAAQGIMKSCNNFSKAMDIAKMGLAAYTAVCGAAQKTCDVACSNSVTDLENFEKKSKIAKENLSKCEPTDPQIVACNNDKNAITALDKLVGADKNIPGVTVAAKAKNCKLDMSSLLTMAAVNLGAVAQSFATSDKCEKESKSTPTPTPTPKPITDTIVDCGLAANADKPVCICKANPRLKGCEGISTSFATNSTLSNGAAGSASGKGLGSDFGNGTDSALNKQFPSAFEANKNDGYSSGSSFGGDSSAGLTSGSSGSSGNSDGSLAKSALGNANILSGESSGGGGYRFGMGNNSSARNLARNIAGSDAKGKLAAMSWSNQVTSNAGKSNFDKIKVRYNENRSSLLNR